MKKRTETDTQADKKTQTMAYAGRQTDLRTNRSTGPQTDTQTVGPRLMQTSRVTGGQIINWRTDTY